MACKNCRRRSRWIVLAFASCAAFGPVAPATGKDGFFELRPRWRQGAPAAEGRSAALRPAPLPTLEAAPCGRRNGDDALKLFLRDATLRPGDSVVTRRGVRVFRGGYAFPHRMADFVALGAARWLPGTTRRRLSTIDGLARRCRP